MAVPEPIACTDDAVAMQFIGEGDVPAPLLKDIRFESPKQAHACFDALIDGIETMLRRHIVHSDLSPFNILYHDQRPWIIDFPQNVDPAVNPNAWELFCRDIDHVVRFFERYGINKDVDNLAISLWEPLFGPVQQGLLAR